MEAEEYRESAQKLGEIIDQAFMRLATEAAATKTFDQTITDGWLRVAPPKDIYDWLERRSMDKSTLKRVEADEFEMTLLARNDPLIDLGLASFGTSIKVAKILFFIKHDDTQADHPCREALPLAVLKNGALSKAEDYSGFPVALFEENNSADASERTAASLKAAERTAAWLGTATEAEISALFSNPELDNTFLSDFIENSGVWASVPEAMRLSAIYAFASNPRLTRPYTGDADDGWGSASYYHVRFSVWSLAQTAPVTTPWAWRIALLYDGLPPSGIKEPFKVASRWFPDPNNADAMKLETLNEHGDLKCYQTIRMHVACAALAAAREENDLKSRLIGSDDIAFRCAAYLKGRLTRDEIRSAFERDKVYAFRKLLHNERFWVIQDTRGLLYELLSKSDDKYGFLRQEYRWVENKFKAEHPNLFAEPVPELADGRAAASKRDIETLEKKIGELRGLIIAIAIVGLFVVILLRLHF